MKTFIATNLKATSVSSCMKMVPNNVKTSDLGRLKLEKTPNVRSGSFIKLFLWILVVYIFSIFTAGIYAQNSTSSAGTQKPLVVYPVVELGNCQDYASCRTYCDDPVNKDICIAFAKAKGFYKADALESNKALVIAQAKLELGCDSPDSCKAVCQKEENIEKCSTFAQKNNLNGGKRNNPGNASFIKKAEETLGCTSEATCKEICQKEENRQKCSNFAKQTGLRGGEQKTGPGGCASEDTCRIYCSDPNNFQACSSFTKNMRSTAAAGKPVGEFKGPGGCTSEEQCREYCIKNPASCKQLGPRLTGTPSGVSKGEQEVMKGYPVPSGMTKDDYCKQYPQRCQVLPQQQSINQYPVLPEGVSKEEYCKTFPQRCPVNPPTLNTNSAGTTIENSTIEPNPVISTSVPTQVVQQSDLNTTSIQPLPVVRGVYTGPDVFRSIFKFLFGF